MRFILLVAFFFLPTASAFGKTCHLERPIAVNGDLLMGVTLHNLVLDRQPKTIPENIYDPDRDRISADFFDISVNGKNIGSLGMRLLIEGKAGLGFALFYVDDDGVLDFRGSHRESDGVMTYETQLTDHYTQPNDAKNPAITKTIVRVANGQIISIQLTTPVFKVLKKYEDGYYVAFTGQHQTLCVKSAE